MADGLEEKDDTYNSENGENIEEQLFWKLFFQDIRAFKELFLNLPQPFDLDFEINCERDENCLVLLSCTKPVEFLKIIAENGADLFVTNPLKKNALHTACEYGRLDVVKFLCENIDQTPFFLSETIDGHSVLHFALRAEQNQEEIIKHLQLKGKLDINQILSSGSTELIETVLQRDFESAKVLCDHGADPNVGISGSYRAIHIACQQPENAKMIQLLLDHGADKHELWRHGQRPIHLAIKHRLVENVSFLLNSGSQFEGRIKLHNKIYRKISCVCLMAWKCPTLVPFLLQRGANPNDIHIPTGSSVLGFVLENNGSKELVESIIKSGANPTVSHRGKSLVRYLQNLDQTLVFMDHGVSLDSIENAIGSLLRLAISERCVENEEKMERNIKYLLSNGAKLHNTQPFKESELIMAIKRRFFRIADIFITVGADLKHIGEKGNSVLHVICKENQRWSKEEKDNICRHIIEKIREAGADFNARNEDGMTPLLCHLFSSSTPDELILERLISNGADMYAVHPSTKKSILLYVIENCPIEVLDVILRAKYNVNKPESNGEAPIFSCLPLETTRKKQSLKKLLEAGASPNARDSSGESLFEHVLLLKQRCMRYMNFFGVITGSLSLCADPEVKENLSLLVKHGADVNIFGKNGNTLLLIAMNEGLFQVADHLIDLGANVNYMGPNNVTTFECCFAAVQEELEKNRYDEITETNQPCVSTMFKIINAGFCLDKVLPNGLFPLEMICRYQRTDTLILKILQRVEKTYICSKKGQEVLYSLLERHPSLINVFIEISAPVVSMENRDRLAFDEFTEFIYFDESCDCQIDDSFLNFDMHGFKSSWLLTFRSKMAKRKAMPTLCPFRGPYQVSLENTHCQFAKIFEELPQCKLLDSYNGVQLEFQDEKSMFDALDMNELVLKNSKVYVKYLDKKCNEEVENNYCPTAYKRMFYHRPLSTESRGNQQLPSNVMHECCEAVKNLIAFERIPLNKMLSWGLYPICVAVKLRSPLLVKFMLDQGADPNIMESWDETPLSLATIHGNQEIIQLLISAKANVNHFGTILSTFDSPRQSLLGRSLKYWHLVENKTVSNLEEKTTMFETVSLLVENGASVNGDTDNVDSCLIEAVRLQDLNIVKYLLNNGANVNHKGIQAMTALHVIFMQHSKSCTYETMVDVLLARGASVNIKSENGETPVHVALRRELFSDVPKLMTLDFDPNITDNKGVSYLMLAARFGAENLVEAFLDIGVDCSLLDTKGNSALHYACFQKCEFSILDMLLEHGCQINSQNIEGITPLFLVLSQFKSDETERCDALPMNSSDLNYMECCHTPVASDDEDDCYLSNPRSFTMNWESDDREDPDLKMEQIVDYILKKGADVNVITKKGLSPLAVLVGGRKGEITSKILSKLLSCNADPNIGDNPPLCFATATLNIPLITKLLEAGADVNKLNRNGESSICCCIKTLQLDDLKILATVNKLIENGAAINSQNGIDSPLHIAVSKRLQKTTELLVKKGANVNHVGRGNATPILSYTCPEKYYIGFPKMADQLFWNHPSSDNVLTILLSNNSNPNVENEEGDSPLNIALAENASVIEVQCLIRAGADPHHRGKDGLNAYQQAISKDLSYLDVLYQECKMIQITNDDFCMFWEKAIEWSNKEHIHKQMESYKAFVRVSFKIFNCKEGCDVNITDEKGNTPLIIYSILNESSVIKCLLDNGANVNHVGHKGWNALHALFSSLDADSKNEALQLLSKHGGDFLIKDETGESVIEKAQQNYLQTSHHEKHQVSREFLICFFNTVKQIENMDTLILEAANQGDIPLVNQLIHIGVDCKVKSIDGVGVLHLCLKKEYGPQYTLKQLLDCVITYRDNGGSFTELDRNENTLLMLLLSSRFELSLNDERKNLNMLLDMLTTNRKIVHRKNSAGLTPIMKAASIKVFQCIKKLWERGAKINAKNEEGDSPLHFCFSENQKEGNVLEIVEFLLDKGAEANSINGSYETPLSLAMDRIKDDVDRLDVVKVLLRSGANPNLGKGRTLPIVKAVTHYDVSTTTLLLQHGAKTEYQHNNKTYFVLYDLFCPKYYHSINKIATSFVQIMVLLNERKNNINKAINGKKPMLHLAVNSLYPPETRSDVVSAMIDMGADVNAVDEEGNTSLASLLSTNGYIDENAMDLCVFLLENGANPNQGCILSKVLKHSLTYSYDKVHYLIEKCLICGANLDVYDNTPNLMLAIASKDINLMKKMIEGGANVNAQDTEGNTSLHFALSTDFEDFECQKAIITLLLSSQICLNTRHQCQKTLLTLLTEKLVNQSKKGHVTDCNINVDLSLFNLLICSGIELNSGGNLSDTCPSPLVALIKAGLFKAATSLITCGYQLHKDVQFENFDLSLNNSASYVCGGVEYQRVNYEDDLKLLQTAIHSFDGIPPLAYICRIKIRGKLLFCTRGAEIESKIKSLPLPITLRAFLSCRDDTFEKDTIHILERTENDSDVLEEDSDDDYEDNDIFYYNDDSMDILYDSYYW